MWVVDRARDEDGSEPDGDAVSLDAALDAFATRQAQPRAAGAEMSVADAAVAFHALDRRDRAPDPAVGLVERLEASLFGASETRPLEAGSPIHHRTATTRPARPKRPADRRPHPFVAWLSTAAMVVLTLGSVLVAFRWSGSPETPQPQGPGFFSGTGSRGIASPIPAASPVSGPRVSMLTGPDIVDVSECTAQPRVPGRVEALVGEEPTRPSALPLRIDSPTPSSSTKHDLSTPASTPDALTGLQQTDASVIEGITATLRQLVACRFESGLMFLPPGWPDINPYDDYNGRFYASFSNDFFRRELTATVSNADLPVLRIAFLLLGPSPPALTQVGQLPDGRAIAVVPDSFFPSVTHRVVFVQDGERWLIDEIQTVSSSDRDFQAEAAAAPQFAEIALFEDHFGVWGPVDPDLKVVADKNLTVTVANLGTLPQRFEIPELGVSLEVQPGHSVAFVVNAPPGAVTLVSYRLDPDGSEARALDGPLTFRPADSFCRFCG